MYNKLFARMLDSSIWLEPNSTRIVWITLLAAMDQDGYAHFAAIENLASRARVTVQEAEKAVECFLAPDPNSSNPANEGRRIERVPGGYIILNAQEHRSTYSRIIEREQTRARVARHRAKKAGVTKGVTEALLPLPRLPEAEAEASTPKPPRGALNGWHPSETQRWLNTLFNRRDHTRWTPREIKALKSIGEITPEDRSLLETYYRHSWPKDADYRRRSLITLLKNFPGDVDKARNFKPKTPKPF